jgi:hypothetical protein
MRNFPPKPADGWRANFDSWRLWINRLASCARRFKLMCCGRPAPLCAVGRGSPYQNAMPTLKWMV